MKSKWDCPLTQKFGKSILIKKQIGLKGYWNNELYDYDNAIEILLENKIISNDKSILKWNSLNGGKSSGTDFSAFILALEELDIFTYHLNPDDENLKIFENTFKFSFSSATLKGNKIRNEKKQTKVNAFKLILNESINKV